MRSYPALWLAFGCNQFYGIEPTILVDARQFDAPPDAAWVCPATGIPRFSSALHQLDVGEIDCVDYTVSVSRGIAMASCPSTTGTALFQGPIDGRLVASSGLDATISMRFVDEPRLTPEGDEVWLRQVSSTGATASSVFSVYQAEGDAWQWSADLGLPVAADRGDEISVPTRRGSGPRRFMFNTPSDDQMFEMEEGSPPKLIHTYRNVDLGMSYIIRPMLSPDGLRLVFGGASMTNNRVTTMYTSRASIDEQFALSTALDEAPAARDPFLTDDCGKLYASGLGRVFYARQP